MYIISNELKHYGVLNMRWGIRRFQPYSVKPRKSGKGGKELGEAKNKQINRATKNLKKYNIPQDHLDFMHRNILNQQLFNQEMHRQMITNHILDTNSHIMNMHLHSTGMF